MFYPFTSKYALARAFFRGKTKLELEAFRQDKTIIAKNSYLRGVIRDLNSKAYY